MTNRAYMREGKALPSLAEQEAALRKLGFTNFTDDSPNVYIDRMKNRREPDLYWRDMLEQQTRTEDRICMHSAIILGRGEREIREVAYRLGDKGASIYDCATAETIKITAEGKALLAFVGRGRDLLDQARSKLMEKARRDSGRLGGRGQYDTYTREQKATLRLVWLAHNGNNDQFEIAAGKALGKPRVPYRTVWNWANPKKGKGRPWPAMGSDLTAWPIKPKRSKRRDK